MDESSRYYQRQISLKSEKLALLVWLTLSVVIWVITLAMPLGDMMIDQILALKIFVSIAIVIVLSWVIKDLYANHLAQDRNKAILYLLGKTSGIYFHKQTVADCLQANVVWELWQNDVGDYTRQMGLLVSCALRGNSRDASVYLHYQKEPRFYHDHFVGLVRFYHDNKWWEFDLLQALDEQNIHQVKAGRGDFAKIQDYEQIKFRKLKLVERTKLEQCENPNLSYTDTDAWWGEWSANIGQETATKTNELVTTWRAKQDSLGISRRD